MKAQGGMKDVALRLFRGLAASYDRTADWATLFQDRYWKAWVTSKAGAPDGGLVLDVGCGTLLLEQRWFGPEHRFIGLDVTEEMARIGWSKGLSNVDLVVNGDAESLPFSDGAFDAVVSCYVPKYVSVPLLARELARIVKPGAPVVLYDFARPRGFLAPLVEVYIQAGLRATGLVLRKTRNGASVAFERLPQIIDGTTWDREIVGSMEREGFETLAATRLTAGAVFAYWGRRRPRRPLQGQPS